VIVAVLAIAVLVAGTALLKSGPQRTGTNSVSPAAFIATLFPSNGPACVRHLDLPPKTGGLRTMLGTRGKPGPRVTMTLKGPDGKVLRTSNVAGFADGRSPVFRFAEFPDGIADSTACFSIKNGTLAFSGSPNGNAAPSVFSIGKTPAPGDIQLDYVRGKDQSALSMLGTVLDRASLFRPSWVGPWTFYLAFLAAIAAIGGAALLLIRLGRGAEFGRWSMFALAAIVFVNAAAWAIVTPAFNVPDEMAHYAYVETVARGDLPEKSVPPGGTGNAYLPSSVLASAYTAVPIIQNANARPPWDKAQEDRFKGDYAALVVGKNSPYGLTPANSYSPLYYAPAALVIKLMPGDGVFGKLLAVRLYSALLVALTALMVLLLAREILPSVWWFAPVAALAVAFEPMFLHVGGGVSNDNLMVLLATTTLYFLARMLRRGPTTALAVAAGSSFALGYLAKPTTLGLAPAMALTFAVLFFRGASDERGRRFRSLAIGFGAFLAIFALGAIIFGTAGSTGAAIGAGNASGAAHQGSVTGLVSYLWQWYLPPLPFMTDIFVGSPPVGSVYLRGFFADFNALDTSFAGWVYVLIALLLVGLVAGAARAVYERRASLRERWPLMALPVTAILGMMIFINFAAYLMFLNDGSIFAQGRYLFPAIGIFGVLVAAGSLGAGRLRGLIVASALVLSLGALNIFGMGLSMARFYL
jgi:uncharacterized membrane protein